MQQQGACSLAEPHWGARQNVGKISRDTLSLWSEDRGLIAGVLVRSVIARSKPTWASAQLLAEELSDTSWSTPHWSHTFPSVSMPRMPQLQHCESLCCKGA